MKFKEYKCALQYLNELDSDIEVNGKLQRKKGQDYVILPIKMRYMKYPYRYSWNNGDFDNISLLKKTFDYQLKFKEEAEKIFNTTITSCTLGERSFWRNGWAEICVLRVPAKVEKDIKRSQTAKLRN